MEGLPWRGAELLDIAGRAVPGKLNSGPWRCPLGTPPGACPAAGCRKLGFRRVRSFRCCLKGITGACAKQNSTFCLQQYLLLIIVGALSDSCEELDAFCPKTAEVWTPYLRPHRFSSIR